MNKCVILLVLLVASNSYAATTKIINPNLSPGDAAKVVVYQNKIKDELNEYAKEEYELKAKIDILEEKENQSPSDAAKIAAYKHALDEEKRDCDKEVAILEAKLLEYQIEIDVPETVQSTKIIREVWVPESTRIEIIPATYEVRTYQVKVIDSPATPGYWREERIPSRLVARIDSYGNTYYVRENEQIIRTYITGRFESSHYETRTESVQITPEEVRTVVDPGYTTTIIEEIEN